jgi:hypothetical protein
MSLRLKYLDILSGLIPAGALGVSLLLGSGAPCGASEHPMNSLPAATQAVSQRLAAIRERSPNSAHQPSGQAKANSSSPGETGGVTADGIMAGGATGGMAGIMVGPIGGTTGEPAARAERRLRLITFRRGKVG